jgi:hypothetical protein
MAPLYCWSTATARLALRQRGLVSTRQLPKQLQSRLNSTATKPKAAPVSVRSTSKPHQGTPVPLNKTTTAPGQSPAVEEQVSTSDDALLEPLPSPPSHAPEGLDWGISYHGLSTEPFPPETSQILQQELDPEDVEIKPGEALISVIFRVLGISDRSHELFGNIDGIIYLPEIKYRRILNRAFGPGGWGLAPRGETNIGAKTVSREYALVCLGRLVMANLTR